MDVKLTCWGHALVVTQFLDPLLLMSEVRREAGRRISFLTAAKSMDRKFIGQAAKLMQSSPSFPARGTDSTADPRVCSSSGAAAGHGHDRQGHPLPLA